MRDDPALEDFNERVWEYYRRHERHDLPWRLPEADGGFDPYKILVSEVMLQQTQVARVIPKYRQFLKRFPSVESLARAGLGDVLRAWNGLGYNRRAKFLHETAKRVVRDYGGVFPRAQSKLVKLPGIGPNTAGAVLAYAFNQPVAFLETNIRTVFIHHFFQDRTGVPDRDILKLVAQTIDHEHPREWYWALMDYGSYLKLSVGNLNKLSKGYSKQSRFEGSRRQIRGRVIRSLSERSLTYKQLEADIADPRLKAVLDDLLKEGLITQKGRSLTL